MEFVTLRSGEDFETCLPWVSHDSLVSLALVRMSSVLCCMAENNTLKSRLRVTKVFPILEPMLAAMIFEVSFNACLPPSP